MVAPADAVTVMRLAPPEETLRGGVSAYGMTVCVHDANSHG